MAEFNNIENLAYLEALYNEYRSDPSAVPPEWHTFFASWADKGTNRNSPPIGASFQPPKLLAAAANGNGRGEPASDRDTALMPETELNEMIRSYRALGHLKANIDPLSRHNRNVVALEPSSFGFTQSHMDKLYACESMPVGKPLTLREIHQRLETIYCGSIGVEFMHIEDRSQREWLLQRFEHAQEHSDLSREDRIHILARLIDAHTFEQFIRKKFIGAKSFSLEGAETLIPLLDFATEKAADDGVEEIVMAMAHRGRLNVLANVLGKNPRHIFREFIDPSLTHPDGMGDVKYHLGHSHNYKIRSGREIHLSLCFNPSHLEFVNPVALGRTRAKQDHGADRERVRAMTLLIHGDASFAGEGIVQETLNLTRLPGYQVGGLLHVVVNNQIGFTTPADEGRSTNYATDIVKMLQLPVFHVNGDDPEAVVTTVRLAMEYRRQFKRSAVIDMVCYRRLGHNEGDEPTFTQPVLYQAITKHPCVRKLYCERLVGIGAVTADEAERLETSQYEKLEQELALARDDRALPEPKKSKGAWGPYSGGVESEAQGSRASIDRGRLSTLLIKQTEFPKSFHPHPKIARGMTLRQKMAQGERPLDWSAAEALAFASLATAGMPIRLSCQDSGRGTFSQRHAILYDYENGEQYIPLQHLDPKQAPIEIYNSPLSEAGVLGFEYGYSLDYPGALVLWEAQFGDFANAAQVMIDQFVTAAEEKWHRLSGLVLLLPHGFEGMGPEHSSARLERFLQLSAKENIQVVYPTTPAQYFHCLRRQALSRWRKPLVLLTPKSLLRHPRAVSTLMECAHGQFEPVIADGGTSDRHPARVILCTGKVYYELEKKRQDSDRPDISIIRIEQLYPFPEEQLRSALAPFPAGTPMVWVQEEPENMGAWWYLNFALGHNVFDHRPLSVVARRAAASPATGSATKHKEQQEQLLNAAMGES